ncbi:MAG: low molecular weight protein tyrosine phosphatase family protein [Hyphomicrobiaceae bacterium]
MNVLFVCSQNRLRSPTAEQVFADWPGIETDSGGLDDSATTPVSPEQIAWADVIVVMETRHRDKLRKRFRAHLGAKRVVSLDIPDAYDFMSPDLVLLLKERAGRFIRGA